MILRPATKADVKMMYHWRNDPQAREMSGNARKISAKEHKAWFSRALTDKKIVQFIAEQDRTPIGTGRLTNAPDGIYGRMSFAEISIIVDPKYRGHGFGKAIVRLLVAKAKEMGKKPIAQVKVINPVSLNMFLSCGAKPHTNSIWFHWP